MELKKVNGLFVTVKRVKNTGTGSPRYEVSVYKDMGEYFCNVTSLLKTNSKGEHICLSYNINETIDNITKTINESFK